jgi:uncharacterized protein YfaS (alpha-2-macroglobulin family)
MGEIQRDTRLVVVDTPRDLTIAIDADKESYLPGETAVLDFGVTGVQGEGVPAILGLAAVDESVFALQEQDPGFLKLYFLLEKALMEPKYDVHGFTLPAIMQTPEETRPARKRRPVQRRPAWPERRRAAGTPSPSTPVTTNWLRSMSSRKS